MFPALFDNTTIPVLHEVMRFAQARHDVLAGNIANLSTPGYRVRDLSLDTFQNRLQEALQAQSQPPKPAIPQDVLAREMLAQDLLSQDLIAGDRSLQRGWVDEVSPGILPERAEDPWQEVHESMKNILYHDETNVDLEQQVTQISKNQFMHNMAITIMNSQFRLLQTAISERV